MEGNLSGGRLVAGRLLGDIPRSSGLRRDRAVLRQERMALVGIKSLQPSPRDAPLGGALPSDLGRLCFAVLAHSRLAVSHIHRLDRGLRT